MVSATSREAGGSTIDTLEYRRALGHFATGVTVVTYQPDDAGEFRGTTVNSFTSVSLDPPLILVSLGRQTRSAATLLPGKPFAVNVLHHGQRNLAIWFASRQRKARAAQGNAHVDWEVHGGVPCLASCGAHFWCVTRDVHQAGDHVLVVGLVEEFRAYGHPPLLFYRGAFEHLPARAAAQPTSEIFSDFPEFW